MISILFPRCLQDFFAGNHNAEVDNFVVITAEHDADNILSDIVDVAFDSSHDDAPLRSAPRIGGSFFFHERHEPSY